MPHLSLFNFLAGVEWLALDALVLRLIQHFYSFLDFAKVIASAFSAVPPLFWHQRIRAPESIWLVSEAHSNAILCIGSTPQIH